MFIRAENEAIYITLVQTSVQTLVYFGPNFVNRPKFRFVFYKVELYTYLRSWALYLRSYKAKVVKSDSVLPYYKAWYVTDIKTKKITPHLHHRRNGKLLLKLTSTIIRIMWLGKLLRKLYLTNCHHTHSYISPAYSRDVQMGAQFLISFL